MAFNYSPKPVIDNSLVLYLDAANPRSYVSGSTVWRDISRGGNTGALTNGPTFNGANGGSIVFDGVDDICPIADIPFRFGNTFTISLWFYWDNINKSKNILGKRNGVTPYVQYGLAIYDSPYLGNPSNKLNWFARPDQGDNGNSFDTWLSYTLGSAGIYNAVVVMAPNNQYLYVNGILQASATKNNSTYTWNIIGKIYTLGGTTDSAQWNNKIYQNSIYNRALSAAEVLQNYNALKGRYNLI